MLLRLMKDQRVAFAVVGGSNTLLGLLFFVVIYASFGRWLGYLGVLCVSYGMAILTGFGLQRRFVFDKAQSSWKTFRRYVLVQLCALLANAVVLPLVVEVVGVPVVPGQVISLGLTMIATFYVHRQFTFRDFGSKLQIPGPSTAGYESGGCL